jgi:hypothetical protein|tara:strand:+ start:463 stop:576 length:114 start_codon:yes stop_codon:yes gene_type:complete
MGIIKYKTKQENIVKLQQFLNEKYVDTNKHVKPKNKI